MKKIFWGITVILAILVGLIPVFYLKDGVSQGYLELKSQETLKNNIWWVFLYMHIVSGGIAILIGWTQFNKFLQKKRLNWHRIIGKLYVISSLIGSISGFYLGFYATGGLLPAMGFITVSCIYFYTTLMGYLTIRKKQLLEHQNFMTYSYATCLAAVSLRLMTPLSYFLGFDYIISYTFIAWFAWIPNLLIAYWVTKNRQAESLIEY